MSKQTNKPATETTNKSAHEIRVNGIRATIWANQTEKGVRYNTTFERSYKDGEDWKNTDSYRFDPQPAGNKESSLDFTMSPACCGS